MRTLAGTGHRGDKIFTDPKRGYTAEGDAMLVEFVTQVVYELQPRKIISGLALGYDTALAEAAIALKVPLHAYVPFEGQERLWREPQQVRYRRILAAAAEVKICCPGGYAPSKMAFRNECMVRALEKPSPFDPGVVYEDLLLALWNGSSGGTANCIEYAISQDRKIENVWDRWEAYKAARGSR